MIKKVYFIFLLILFSCSEEFKEERIVVDVNYYTPVYESATTLASRITIEEPKEYTTSGKIVTYKNHIFISNPEKGIHIIDNSDPSNPVNKTFIAIKGNSDIAIVDNYLYSDMYSALVTFDISNLSSPTILSDYTVENLFYHNPYDISLPEPIISNASSRFGSIDTTKGIVIGWNVEKRTEERTVCVSGCGDVFTTLDASLAPLATETSTSDSSTNITGKAGSLSRFLPIGDFLYTINFSEIIVLQLDAQKKPTKWSKLNANTTAETLFTLNNLLFVGSVSGMLLYDVTDPSNPSYINSIDHIKSCDPVVANDTHAFVTIRGGNFCPNSSNELLIIDIQDVKNLKTVSTFQLFNPHGLALKENHLLICDGSAGLKVMDVSDVLNPKAVGSNPIDFAYDVIIEGNNAIVTGENKLYQFDISELPKLKLTSEVTINTTTSLLSNP